MRRIVILVTFATLLAGCATAPKSRGPKESFYKSERMYEAMKVKRTYPSTGSLWTDNYFYSDIRARRVGDIVTIVVREYASSRDYGATESKESLSFSSILKSLFGLKDDVSRVTGLQDPTNLLDVSGSGNYKGSGKIEQTSSLQTKITAVVTQVLPNGNLVVEGRRTIVVNGERKIIAVRGVVRPQDIKPDNTVSSEALADAEIVYEGKGIVTQSHTPGLFTKLLMFLWPLL